MARLCPWLTGALFLAVSAAAGAAETLPLTRVRLYETGVAYFERSGKIGENAVSLPVPAGHLDDALKTLVVYSKAGATRVGGVEFASSVSRAMGLALAGLAPGANALSLTVLLASLKGANVVVSLEHEKLEGRIVDVLATETSDLETCVRTKPEAPCEKSTVPTLVLLTRHSELHRVPLASVTSARPTDPTVAARLNAALDALSGGSARVLKELRVLAQGQNVALGYVSEAPVWRASYRLVLGDGDHAALQGWALVHNDTDEAWHGITLELVNGRPDSFLFPLAAPRYARRELVTPENPLSTVPQLLRATPDALWNVDDDALAEGGLGLSGIGEGGGGHGEGIGLGAVGTLGHGSGTSGDDPSSLLAIGNLASVAPSEGVEAGALFRYTLGEKLDLRAHGSALVPFLGEGVEARRVALFTEPTSTARSAVYVTHHGERTLPEGTLAVFGDGGFAGESALPRLKPSETTTVEYGADLDMTLTENSDQARDEPRALRFQDWELVEHYARHHEPTFHLENKSGEKRDVFVGLTYVNNATVTGADELVYDSRHGRAFAVFALGARAAAERELHVTEGLTRRRSVRKLTSSELATLAHAPSLPAKERALVGEAASWLAQAEGKRRALQATNAELDVREAEVERYREHARALGAAHGTEDVVARLLSAEDRAEALRRGARTLATDADELGRKATRVLVKLGE